MENKNIELVISQLTDSPSPLTLSQKLSHLGYPNACDIIYGWPLALGLI